MDGNMILDGQNTVEEKVRFWSRNKNACETTWDICRESTLEEAYCLGCGTLYTKITFYQGKIYRLNDYPSEYQLWEGGRKIYCLKQEELGPVCLGRFEVKYKDRWYPLVCVGREKDSFVLDIRDPENLSGRARYSKFNEFEPNLYGGEIDGIRLRLSHPINDLFLD